MADRVKASIGAILTMTLSGAPALAQRTVIIPDGPAAPTPNYSSVPMPNYNGGADFGAALRGPDGRICVSTPGLIGKPQYGTITTCYADRTQVEQSRADRPTTLYGEPAEADTSK
jgi:hypothetical protein